MHNGWWALILVALLGLLTFALVRWSRSTSRIAVLHNCVWGLAILLVGSGLIVFMEAGTLAWLTLAAGLVAFNLGVWVAGLRRSRESPAAAVPALHGPPALAGRATLIVLIGTYGAAFVVYLSIIQARFGLATLILNPVAIRSSGGESYLESVPLPVRLLLNLGPVVFALLALRTAVDKPLPVGWRIAGLAFVVLSMLAMLQRVNLFMAVFWVAALLITQRSSATAGRASVGAGQVSRAKPSGVSPKVVVTSSAALVVIAFLGFQVVGGALGKNSSTIAVGTGNVSEILQETGLVSPFLYYTGGIPAFLQLTESTTKSWPPPPVRGELRMGDYNPQTWGAATFSKVFQVFPIVRAWPSNNAFIDMGTPINVFTWLEPFYRDFRLVGVVVGGFVLGWSIGALYRRRFRSARWYWIQAAFVSIVFLATFAPRFNNTLFLCELAAVLFLTMRRPQAWVKGWWARRDEILGKGSAGT